MHYQIGEHTQSRVFTPHLLLGEQPISNTPSHTHMNCRGPGYTNCPTNGISAPALDLKSPPSSTSEPRLQAHSGVGQRGGGCPQQVLNSSAAGLQLQLESTAMGKRVRTIVQHPPTPCS